MALAFTFHMASTLTHPSRSALPIFTLSFFLGVCLAVPARAQDVPPSLHTKERVTFKSSGNTLVGFLFKPDGPGPFPGLVWNHGSEKNPDAAPQFDAVAAVFVPAGYVVFAPVRRGHGDSQGPYIVRTASSWQLEEPKSPYS
jgi:dipeptidyl aminopeptidase/acylaminoacyl peptidase